MSKIGIIGIGHVGSHVASAILQQGLCDTLVLIDKDEKKSEAHAFDLVDASLYYPFQTRIIVNDYNALDDADIVVVSVAGSIVCESRLKETETSIGCVNEFLPKLKATKFHGIILSITNPCDIVANYIALKSDYKVIGSGTTLDSARLKQQIGAELNINPTAVNAFMLGEHGDSQFPFYSNASICGVPLSEYAPNIDYEKITHDVRFRAVPIFASKKCTEFGIGTCAAKLCRAILNDTRELLPVSYYVDLYGKRCYLSLPCYLGRDGVVSRPAIKLTAEEEKALQNCVEIISSRVEGLL